MQEQEGKQAIALKIANSEHLRENQKGAQINMLNIQKSITGEGDNGLGHIKQQLTQLNQKEQIANIFNQLVSIINAHYKNANMLHNDLTENQKQKLSPDFLLPRRIQSRRKTNKLYKSTHLQSKQPQKQQTQHFIKQTTPIIALKTNFRQTMKKPNYNNKIGEKIQRNNETTSKKKNVLENYELFMTYRIHESQDQGQAQTKQQLMKRIKIKNSQISASENSFAHSSRNMEEWRKFSIQRSVQLLLGHPKQKSEHKMSEGSQNYQISPQFDIKLNQNQITVVSCQITNPNNLQLGLNQQKDQ